MRRIFRLLAVLFFVSLAASGCGYQLRLIDLSDEEKREALRHEEVTGAIFALRTDVKRLQEKASGLEQGSQQTDRAVKDLQKQRAGVDARVDEMGLSLRLLQGSLEKRDHRFQELVDGQEVRIEDFAASQKGLGDRLSGLETRFVGFDQGQQQRVSDLATKVEELTRNIPPLLADQAANLKTLSKNLETYSNQGAGEVDHLTKSLTSLSKALDLLGQKITAKVDEQDRSIKKISKRLETMEAKAGQGKRSAVPQDREDPPTTLAPIFYRVAQVSRDLGNLQGAWEAFGSASEDPADPDWASLALLRRSEMAASAGDGETALKELERLVHLYPASRAAEVGRERIEENRSLLMGDPME